MKIKNENQDDVLLMKRNRYFKAFKSNWVLYNFTFKGLIV